MPLFPALLFLKPFIAHNQFASKKNKVQLSNDPKVRTGGSILAPVSNSKGGENLCSKPSRWYVGLSRGRKPETLVPQWSFMGHFESSAAAVVCLTPPFPMVHGTRLGRRRLGAKWRRARVLRKLC